jgi:hypothetical protein
MTKRNNEERLGLPSTGAKESADVSAAIEDAGLSFVSPTEMVDLPSEGKYYQPGHPLHNETTIEIREMTAKEEDILTSQSLIQKGVVFDKLLKNIIVDARISQEHLLVGDKSAILVAARISAYGEMYETKTSCPNCYTEQDMSFDLRDAGIKGPPDLAEVSDEVGSAVRDTGNGTFIVTLPKSQMDVEIKLITGDGERKISLDRKSRKKKKQHDNILTGMLKACIVSVSGTDNRQEIERFIDNMPAQDSRFVRKVMAQVTPNINLTQEFVCEECDHEQDLEVPVTTDFFWPDE